MVKANQNSNSGDCDSKREFCWKFSERIWCCYRIILKAAKRKQKPAFEGGGLEEGEAAFA